MNKKFSTLLTASLLMVGALFSSAQATDYIPVGPKAEAISSGSMYYIVQQADEDVATTDYLMGMKKTDDATKNIDVIATAIQDVNYITTIVRGEGSLFKVASTKLVKAVSLLKEEKAPSVFNIQFVSGKGTKDSEFNKYMGVAIADGTAFTSC